MDYKALVVSENSEGVFGGEICTLNTADLPEGDLLIKVNYSSVNYKDALSFSGNKGVTQAFPHTPGIDATGEVVESHNAELPAGTKVIVTGYDLGMNTKGGFGEYIRVSSAWVIKLPLSLPEKEAMAWGTAGLTAALCVDKLISNHLPKTKPVLVSGATGGVGSIAVMLLAKLGYQVHALTSKMEQADYLKSIGAQEVILRDAFIDESKRPLLKPSYSGAVDVAGGNVLASILKTIDYQGSVACCGLVASPALNTTVLPFILRDVSLLGVDSVMLPLARKQDIWNKIAGEWRLPELVGSCKEITKADLAETMSAMLKGVITGRFILAHS
ncbi:YhdH/YhfP family quinone oxidoreductase [Pseudomonas sp. HK3]